MLLPLMENVVPVLAVLNVTITALAPLIIGPAVDPKLAVALEMAVNAVDVAAVAVYNAAWNMHSLATAVAVAIVSQGTLIRKEALSYPLISTLGKL
jgi:hypothetical protein